MPVRWSSLPTKRLETPFCDWKRYRCNGLRASNSLMNRTLSSIGADNNRKHTVWDGGFRLGSLVRDPSGRSKNAQEHHMNWVPDADLCNFMKIPCFPEAHGAELWHLKEAVRLRLVEIPMQDHRELRDPRNPFYTALKQPDSPYSKRIVKLARECAFHAFQVGLTRDEFRRRLKLAREKPLPS